MSEAGYYGLGEEPTGPVYDGPRRQVKRRPTRERAVRALYAPWSDEQGERAHGDVTAAQGSSAGDEGEKR